MKTVRKVSSRFCVIAVVSMLAACGGAQSASPGQATSAYVPASTLHSSAVVTQSVVQAAEPLGTPLPPFPTGPRPAGWLSPDAASGAPVIYLADQYGSQVQIFNEADGTQVGKITDGIGEPYGLFVDRGGILYVVNSGSGTVTSYKSGTTTPATTWSQDLDRPLYAVVDASGDLFVSNADNGTVVEYQSGSTAPSEVLQTPGVEADGMDFDRQGNLYVAYRTHHAATGGSIEVFAPGSTVGTSLGMVLDQPQGLIVDTAGKISVVETGSKQRLAHFLVGKTKLAQLFVDGTSAQYLSQLAFDEASSELYVAATYAGGPSGQALTLPYPFKGSSTLDEIVSKDGIFTAGIALSNGQSF